MLIIYNRGLIYAKTNQFIKLCKADTVVVDIKLQKNHSFNRYKIPALPLHSQQGSSNECIGENGDFCSFVSTTTLSSKKVSKIIKIL